MSTSCAPKSHASADAAPRTVTLTVGTAGHIDHGKTALVKYLTGCSTDRLPEEKARGMTIDLGFATCELPDHRQVGIVDVPGHERFIHNMVAGVSGIDVAILVVAADDGVMPQTIEHFHILRLLGVASGMVVINKIDLVSEERVSEVEQQVVSMSAGSFLEGAPIVGFSAMTGAGFDHFYSTFVETVNRTAERDASGPFRMHVERMFTLKGLGTIVSGIPCSGSVHVGDSIALLPKGTKRSVRSIQVYGVDSDAGQNGECLALKLSKMSRNDVTRGMVLGSPGYFEPTRFINGFFHLLPELSKPIRPRTAVKVHIGTAQVAGHLVLPELTPMRPGGESYVQLQLKSPVVAAPGDPFVIRQLSPVRTIGGGHVVCCDTMRMRRSRGNWVDQCKERDAAFRSPSSAVRYAIDHYADEPLDFRQLAHIALLNESVTREQLVQLLAENVVTALPSDRFVLTASVAAANADVVTALTALHDEKPLAIGFPKHELFRKLVARTDRAVIDKALALLLQAGTTIENDAGLQLAERAPKLRPRQAVLASKILEIYDDAAYRTPRLDELPEMMGVPALVLNPIFSHLTQTGELVSLDDKVILHHLQLNASRTAITEYLRSQETLDASLCKILLDTTRKYVIPILEYWDQQGLTRRVGNARILREK